MPVALYCFTLLTGSSGWFGPNHPDPNGIPVQISRDAGQLNFAWMPGFALLKPFSVLLE